MSSITAPQALHEDTDAPLCMAHTRNECKLSQQCPNRAVKGEELCMKHVNKSQLQLFKEIFHPRKRNDLMAPTKPKVYYIYNLKLKLCKTMYINLIISQ